MKINEMSKADLELLSLCDLTALILKETNKPMNTPTIFKRICELLEYSDDDYANKIGEYYTSLTTDKRFFMLDTAEWDLRDNHAVKISIDDDEEEVEEDETEEESQDEEEDIEENIDNDELDMDDEDDIEEFAIVEEEEIDA